MRNIIEILESFGAVYHRLVDVKTSPNGTVSGNITMTAENLSALNLANQVDLIPAGAIYFDKNHLELSEYGDRLVSRSAIVNLTLTIPDNVYRSWDELLSNRQNRLVMPTHFMIIEDGYRIYSTNDDDSLIRSYHKIIELISYLKNAVDHENNEVSFVYLSRSKLTIDIIYGKQALEKMNESNFDLFTEIMQEPEHYNQKKYILQETLFNMLLQVIQRDRFESLLDRLQEFIIQFEHSYRLFVTSFSFDSVRREYEEKYRDYNGKLNASISDVATKALATPITMLFSISNISTTSTSVSNYAIVVSSILVSTFMLFLVRSNADCLQAISEEYTKLFDRLASELVGNANGDSGRKSEVEKLKIKLDNRVTTYQHLHKLTMMSAIASSIFVVGYLFWLKLY